LFLFIYLIPSFRPLYTAFFYFLLHPHSFTTSFINQPHFNSLNIPCIHFLLELNLVDSSTHLLAPVR